MNRRTGDAGDELRRLPNDLRRRVRERLRTMPGDRARVLRALLSEPFPLGAEQVRVLLQPHHGAGRVEVRGPAGSGKTSLLVRRCLLDLLVENGPAKVLCVLADPAAVREFEADLGRWCDRLSGERGTFVEEPGRRIRAGTVAGIAWDLLVSSYRGDAPALPRRPSSGPDVPLNWDQRRASSLWDRLRITQGEGGTDGIVPGADRRQRLNDADERLHRRYREEKDSTGIRDERDVLRRACFLLDVDPVLRGALRQRFRVHRIDDYHRLSVSARELLERMRGVHTRVERYQDSRAICGATPGWTPRRGGPDPIRLDLRRTHRCGRERVLLLRELPDESPGGSVIRAAGKPDRTVRGPRTGVFEAFCGAEERTFVTFTIRSLVDREGVDPGDLAVFYVHPDRREELLGDWDDELDCWGPGTGGFKPPEGWDRLHSLLYLLGLILGSPSSGGHRGGNDPVNRYLSEWLADSELTDAERRRIERRVPLASLLNQPHRMGTLAVPLRPTVRDHLRDQLAELRTLAEQLRAGESLLENEGRVRRLLASVDNTSPAAWESFRGWLRDRTPGVDPARPLRVLGRFQQEVKHPVDREGVAVFPAHRHPPGTFHTVFVVGMEEAALPGGTGEESTLCARGKMLYTLLTRAREQCVFSFARRRPERGTGFREPARILRHLPSDLVVRRRAHSNPLLRWVRRLLPNHWFEPLNERKG